MAPDFLIVGAQRCGTTSLHRALSRHPLVATPVAHKGVHYFDTAFTRSPEWYRGHFPTRAALRRQAARIHQEAVRVRVFESSPYYMFHPAAPERIAETLPGCKVIAILRDPTERAYSQYAHEVARGFETAASFEHALDLEPARLMGEEERLLADPGYVSFAHQHQAYAGRSDYGPQLRRLEASLSRSCVLAVDFDRLSREPEATLSRVLEFLELPAAAEVTMGHHNARPRSTLAHATRSRLRKALAADSEQVISSFLGHRPSWLE